MLFIRNCTAALLAGLLTAGASASQPTAPAAGHAEFLIFLGGREAGREQVNLARSGGNWIITSTGRISLPIQLTINRFEAKYAADWQPLEMHAEATMAGNPIAISTSFGLTTAVNEITQGGTTNSKTDQISARSVILPNNFFGAYEALAARLATAAAGTEIPAYIAPQAEIKVTVKAVHDDAITSPSGSTKVRKFDLTFHNPGGPLAASVTVDERSRVARVEIPAAGLTVVRADLATVAMRQQTVRNPTDADVMIPALGFNIAATITTPPAVAGRLRHPAVVLVPGSGAVDRDETVAGIPIFAQLAGSLAERGYLVVRYDKRGVGQSGGRIESATIQDYADDVLSIVRWLQRRKDVDRRGIALAGHSEGGAVALIAGSKKDDIAALVLIAAPGTRGSDLVLEQQRRALEQMEISDEERKQKVALQEQIQTAVLTGIGWEGVPPELRRRADTAWFRSLLEFDPAKVMPRVRQPLLIIQGDLDRQVLPYHADRLAELARARKRKAPVEVVHLPGVNHLLVRATTGEVAEYGELKEKTIVPEVAQKIAEWLKK
ncbi:MAG TPA: alpha/beta fold hydrolase [Vicinamibacterales bacterium]|nr:alpha/beta fold hydrolase [Vicinamibacterales bacterium]